MNGKSVIQIFSKYRLPIMGFATLWILMFHVYMPVLGRYDRLLAIESFIKRIGFCGVDIFLIASGIGLVHAIEKYDIWTFYKRRFLHVYPPFLFAGCGIAFFRKWELKVLFEKVLFIQFFRDNIFSYLWYVPAILLFYLCFPLYYKLFKQARNKSIFVCLSLGIWLMFSILLGGIMRSDFYGITNRIPVFIVGILVGWLIHNKVEIVVGLKHWLLAIVVLIVGLVLAYLTNMKDMYLLVPTSNCCIPNFCMATSIYFLLSNILDILDRKLQRIGNLVIKFLSFYGCYSLSIYCIQEYLNTDFMKNPPSNNSIVLNMLLLICITCAGIGLHFFCELVKKGCSLVCRRKII